MYWLQASVSWCLTELTSRTVCFSDFLDYVFTYFHFVCSAVETKMAVGQFWAHIQHHIVLSMTSRENYVRIRLCSTEEKETWLANKYTDSCLCHQHCHHCKSLFGSSLNTKHSCTSSTGLAKDGAICGECVIFNSYFSLTFYFMCTLCTIS